MAHPQQRSKPRQRDSTTGRLQLETPERPYKTRSLMSVLITPLVT